MKLRNILFGAVVLSASCYAANFNPSNVTSKSVREYFRRLLPTTTITSIYTTPYPNTYALILGGNIVYGNLRSSYLMAGHLFDVYTRDDLTATLQKIIRPKIEISNLNISDALLAKSPNKVNKKLIIFLDPDCPYCRRLEQQIEQKKTNQQADIYYLLMPLSIHPNAKVHARKILCSMQPLITLKEYMLKNNEDPRVNLLSDCSIDPLLERIGSTARSLSIDGTPAIVTGTGELIMGDDINAISTYLAQK